MFCLQLQIRYLEACALTKWLAWRKEINPIRFGLYLASAMESAVTIETHIETYFCRHTLLGKKITQRSRTSSKHNIRLSYSTQICSPIHFMHQVSSYFYIGSVLLLDLTAMTWILRCTSMLSADFHRAPFHRFRDLWYSEQTKQKTNDRRFHRTGRTSGC